MFDYGFTGSSPSVTLLIALISGYSLLVAALLIIHWYLRNAHGIVGSTEVINKLAGTRKIVAFEVYSYFSLAVWVVLVLPWVDLLTFQWFSHFKDDGIKTYFGWMTSREGSIYFLAVLLNILGAKGAMTLAELAGLLRKGRVCMVPRGIFWVFMPEQ